MKTGILIMAAGMGSRFGGMKQLEPVGPNGQIILDYSVYDAVKAGFDTAVVVIRKNSESDFRNAFGKRIERLIDVKYVYQELDILPGGFSAPTERTKPWGTGHAVLCAKDAVDFPFVIINADDYYGQSAYKKMHDYISSGGGMCMAGYKLGNTLSKNGTVSRGICSVEDGFLKKIEEFTDLSAESGFPADTTVSMNMWGLTPDIFEVLEKDFISFLKDSGNDLKKEFFLPSVIGSMIENGSSVKVIPTDERWYGVTYKEDAEAVRRAMKSLTEKGLYEVDF